MDFEINKNAYYRIEHSYTCELAGYLIVTPGVYTKSLTDLPIEYLVRLGETLALAGQMIQAIIKPIKIYCGQFGEENDELHFHLFPRTQALTLEYLKDYPQQKHLIHGPVLFDWARTKYRNNRQQVWDRVSPVVSAMRKYSQNLSDAEK